MTMTHPTRTTFEAASPRAQAMFRAFFDLAKENLSAAAEDAAAVESRAAARFLESQKIPPKRADEFQIGLCRTTQGMALGLELEGFSAEEIAASGLSADERTAGRLVGPVFGPKGRIVNFWAVRPKPGDSSVLFHHDPHGEVRCDLRRVRLGDVLSREGLAAFLALIHGEPEQETPPARPARRRVGYCRLHDCDETDCFCFD